MKKLKKGILLLLAFVMALSCLAVPAMADEDVGDPNISGNDGGTAAGSESAFWGAYLQGVGPTLRAGEMDCHTGDVCHRFATTGEGEPTGGQSRPPLQKEGRTRAEQSPAPTGERGTGKPVPYEEERDDEEKRRGDCINRRLRIATPV